MNNSFFIYIIPLPDVLVELDASSNKIERLPKAEIWECKHLHSLNLKH